MTSIVTSSQLESESESGVRKPLLDQPKFSLHLIFTFRPNVLIQSTMHKKIENAVSRALNQTKSADSRTRLTVSSAIPPNQNIEGAASREQAVKRHLPPNQDDWSATISTTTDGCDDLDKVLRFDY